MCLTKVGVKLQEWMAWCRKKISYKKLKKQSLFLSLLDVLFDVLQAVELLQSLVQDLVHSYVFLFRLREALCNKNRAAHGEYNSLSEQMNQSAKWC